MTSPFDSRRQANAEEKKRLAAEASLHMTELMNSSAGLWLIRKVLDYGEPFNTALAFNSRDYYALGKRSVALHLLWLMRQYGDDAKLAEIISELPLKQEIFHDSAKHR